ncbi:MAG: ATP phosphoribosyltransferase [Actinomycetes bacterium]
MLRIAVPNKGALSEPARTMLREAGYLRSAGANELFVQDPINDAEFFFLRPRDIAIYVGAGQLDLGITGRDMLLDSRASATEVLALGFGGSQFRLAAPPGTATGLADLQGKRIATAYPGVLAAELAAAGVQASIVSLDGAVENAVALGVADAVADVVDTGTTLRKAGLVVVGPTLLDSEALLVRPNAAGPDQAVDTFVRRLSSVMVARGYVMVSYDIRIELLDQSSAITPGLESPTISPLREKDWVAVSAMVSRHEVHRVMDELYEIGGRGILVTDILACRL